MTRKRKDYRELKVSSFSGYGYKSAPMLRIQGLWLEELGFNIGDPILVKCEDGKLIITVDHAREDAETKEQAFLDEEMKKLQKKFEVEKKKIYQQVVAERKVRYRCEICGSNGKSMRCPLRVKNHDYTGAPGQKKTIAVKCEECPYGYNRLFRPMNGKLNFSTLDVQDGEGNVDSFEPESKKYSNADTYIRLLKDLGDYVTEHYPKYAKYVELINLLGSEYDMKTASQIMGKADSTLYALKVSHLSGACSGRFLVLPPLTLVALHGEQKYLMRSLPSFIF